MAIEFHCDHCGMLVRTSEENAGKRGKCPGCGQSVYIPTPSEMIEPLDLAPLDPEAEAEKQRLYDEGRKVAEQLRSDKTEVPPETSQSSFPEPVADARLAIDVEALVIEYALAMSEGRLAEAEEYARDIRANMDEADDVIQRITADDIPPRRLKNIPHPVLVGFLRQLQK